MWYFWGSASSGPNRITSAPMPGLNSNRSYVGEGEPPALSLIKSHFPLLFTDSTILPTRHFRNSSRGIFRHLGLTTSTSDIFLPVISFDICLLRIVSSGSSNWMHRFQESQNPALMVFRTHSRRPPAIMQIAPFKREKRIARANATKFLNLAKEK